MLFLLAAPLASATPADLRDLERMLTTLERRYAYLDPALTDLAAARATLGPLALAADSGPARIAVFEQALEILADPHATLGTNTAASTRLVPSALDLWAEERDGEAVVTAVRAGWPAADAGLRPGDRLTRIGALPVTEAIEARLPCCVDRADPRARRAALLALLAGTHDTPRRLTLADGRELVLGDPDAVPARPPVTFERRDTIGVVVVHHLGDRATVPAFDAALEALRGCEGLVIDLRDTAAGGDTTVAEPILGRFVTERAPYQGVVPVRGRPWSAEVRPRGPWTWERPVAVLVDRWTGSMGEGLALGFDATGAGVVVGTDMAGLLGAVHTFTLPASGLRWNLPTDRLTHVDGTPRERWAPRVVVDPGGDGDPVLERALALLRDRGA